MLRVGLISPAFSNRIQLNFIIAKIIMPVIGGHTYNILFVGLECKQYLKIHLVGLKYERQS